MDFLDEDDEDNVGDVDQDVENVLLGSDDEETHPAHHSSKSLATSSGGIKDLRSDHSEEEDVLNLIDEEPLDFDGDSTAVQEGGRRVPPVKFRGSAKTFKEANMTEQNDAGPSCSTYGENYDAYEDTYPERMSGEDDDCEEQDEETENKNTRTRFTIERNVENRTGGLVATGSNSVGNPIQSLGERKVRPAAPEGRPKYWNHNIGHRQLGPRHPSRNHRFQNPPRPLGPGGPGEHPHMRPHMLNPPIIQFNEGIFTDFNQPIRHPHHRPRLPPPNRLEPPRNSEHPHRPPNQMGVRPNFVQPPPQNMRPFFPPQEHGPHGPPRLQHPNNLGPPMQQQPPSVHQPRPDFSGGRGHRPRFPHNMNLNQRNPRPPPNLGVHNAPYQERHPFPQRFQQRPFRPHPPNDLMNGRLPNPNHGFQPPPGNVPSGFVAPPHQPMHPGGLNLPGRFPGPSGGHQHEINPNSPFFMQHSSGSSSYHPGQEPPPFHPDGPSWHGAPEPLHQPNQQQGPWLQSNQPQQSQQNFGSHGYGFALYDQSQCQPASNTILVDPNLISQQHAALQHPLEVPSITKSIYIKPNSEIHEALSKGHLRHHLKDDEHDRRHESHSGGTTYEPDRYYERDSRDRDRPTSRGRSRSPSSSGRRRDDDYYDEDRKSYHHYNDRRPRRKYEDERKYRSESPDKKIGRTDRSSDHYDRGNRERVVENKDSDKLMEEAKKMGLGEDYVKKLEEQRKLRERILKTKEQRRKQVKVAGGGTDKSSDQSKELSRSEASSNASAAASARKAAILENAREIEADSTVATGKCGKPKKILRIVRDKSGKIISKKVHVVVVAKPQQDGQQSASTS